MKTLEFSLQLLRQIRDNRQITVCDTEFLIAIANGCKTNRELSVMLGIGISNVNSHIKRLRNNFLIISSNDRPRQHTITEEGRYQIRQIFSFLKDV